ncbi:MAG: beta-hydroxyacyl-ACP dehydratase [Phycisphaerales bacterium]|nr:beta-hydroxyacyl-ACP dehydratase [Phycisphaerae bacterium]MDG1137193.1 beta-hydroxyacyl-ACP dehydratase [Phycisphaerales bacterium]|tara:strand:- start:6720 stop:7193 length:474 start_codon:yes stop_codon:yes gene_type:complete
MAFEPIIDISTIDLTCIALSEEEVGKINPQAGDMRQLNHVAWLSDDNQSAVGMRYVKDDEFWVDGHIPGRPIYPGVLMIEAAAQISSILYHLNSEGNHFMGFTRCDDCSFRGQVLPGDTLVLSSIIRKFQRRRFICDAQGFVDGNFVFEAKITGMMM